MKLLPLVEVEGVGHANPAIARFLVEKGGATLAISQKAAGESDADYLARVDKLYAEFAAALK